MGKSATERVEAPGAEPTHPGGFDRRDGWAADFLFDAFYGGAVGGSVLALFFLVVDLLHGTPLHTPSLVGRALFTDIPADPLAPVRLDMVAYFTVVHFAVFFGVGALLALGYQASAPLRDRPVVLVALTFSVLTIGFAVASIAVMPNVAPVLGLPLLFGGNLLAAIAMVVFLRWSHRPRSGTSA